MQVTRVLSLEQGRKERTTGLVVTLELSDDADRDAAMALEGRFRPVLSDSNGHAAGTEPA